MKSYTDLEQSKKLTEILPQDSADMFYKYVLPKSDKIHHIPEIGNPINSLKWYNEGYTFRGKKEPITLNEYCVPCWSLAALLEALDDEITDKEGNDYTLTIVKENLQYQLYYHDAWGQVEDIETDYYDDMVDACYEMLVKLHKLNLL